MSTLPDFDAHWNYADAAGTEEVFREILADHPDAPLAWHLELETQIARTLGLQEKFDAAYTLLDQVDERLDDTPVAKIRSLLERGRVHNSSGAADKAAPLFNEAFELAETHDHDPLAIDAAHMIAIVEKAEAALAWNNRALAIAEASDQEGAARWKGSLYNNIGWTYHDMGDFEQALELFEKGVAFRREQGKPEPLRIARWTVAHTLRMLDRPEDAFEKLRAIERDYPDTDDPYVDEELGECLLVLERPEEARPHFKKAWEGLKDDGWLQKNEPERLERLRKFTGVE